MTGERIPPRIAVLDPDAPRLDAPAQLAPPTRWPFGTLTLGLAATIRTVNDPTSVLALLRDGPAADLRTRAEALGQEAAVGVFALTAAMPSPVLDAMVVIWRGLRLIRDVAALHGMRPGLLGTVALLRRTLASASVSALTNVAVDTGMRMLVSHPTIARLSGDAAGAMVAARRMMVLARAAAAACSPLVTND